MTHPLFEDLFVLELANNHWGSVARGLQIIEAFAAVAKANHIKAAIKLQFREKNEFVHPEYSGQTDLRYVWKTEQTYLENEEFLLLVNAIRAHGLIPMATPFDEASVALCAALDLPIIKIASSDLNDWPLLEAVAQLKRPVICSTGGATFEQIDETVAFFAQREIPLAINQCVSQYPCEDEQLELHQVAVLKQRYPEHEIGLSTHEYHDWQCSVAMAYAMGARLFERHIDIDLGDHPVSPYCSLPEQVDVWFKAFNRAKTMYGHEQEGRNIPASETAYLKALWRGVYAKRDLPAGYEFKRETLWEDVYLAIPYLDEQVSCQQAFALARVQNSIPKNAPLNLLDVCCGEVLLESE